MLGTAVFDCSEPYLGVSHTHPLQNNAIKAVLGLQARKSVSHGRSQYSLSSIPMLPIPRHHIHSYGVPCRSSSTAFILVPQGNLS